MVEERNINKRLYFERYSATLFLGILVFTIACEGLLVGIILACWICFIQNARAAEGIFVLVDIAIPVVVVGGFIAMLTIQTVQTWRKRRMAKKQTFQVVLDRLKSSGADVEYGPGMSKNGRRWCLDFVSFGVYTIPKNRYYTWSKVCSMSDEGICNAALPNDTFYIVTENGRTVLAVYNTKFFEYMQ